jgi:hypothetical protein
MIALRDNLPLVRFDDGQVAGFEREWLVRSLARAARKAGYPGWWLARHVAESVATYLALNFEENVIGTPQLAKAVQSVLQVIGYAEVAAQFVPAPPPAYLSLFQLAREAGSGYELAFFYMLGRKIQNLLAARTTYFELSGLDRCVRQLRAKKVWSRDCAALRSEIVTFVREQIGAARHDHEIVLSLR